MKRVWNFHGDSTTWVKWIRCKFRDWDLKPCTRKLPSGIVKPRIVWNKMKDHIQ